MYLHKCITVTELELSNWVVKKGIWMADGGSVKLKQKLCMVHV